MHEDEITKDIKDAQYTYSFKSPTGMFEFHSSGTYCCPEVAKQDMLEQIEGIKEATERYTKLQKKRRQARSYKHLN